MPFAVLASGSANPGSILCSPMDHLVDICEDLSSIRQYPALKCIGNLAEIKAEYVAFEKLKQLDR